MSVEGKLAVPWTAEDVAQLEALVIQAIDLKEIALRLGRTQGAVQSKLNRLRGGARIGQGAKRKQRRDAGASFFLS